MCWLVVAGSIWGPPLRVAPKARAEVWRAGEALPPEIGTYL